MSTDARQSGLRASSRRVRLIARNALSEALHLRLTSLLGLIGAAFVVGALGLRQFNFGHAELKFIADFGLGALGLVGTLLAALVTAQLFFNELQTRAVYCVLTRPVRRWEYVAGKFFGVAGLLALFVAVLGLLLATLLIWRGAQLGVSVFEVRVFLAACALQWLKITLVAVMTLLVCSYAGSALFASSVGLLFAVIAHLQSFAAGGAWAWLRIWPNLTLFNAEGLMATGQMPGARWLLGIGGYWTVYVILFGALASYVFNRRDL